MKECLPSARQGIGTEPDIKNYKEMGGKKSETRNKSAIKGSQKEGRRRFMYKRTERKEVTGIHLSAN